MHQEPSPLKEELMNTLYYVRPGNKFVPNFDLFKRQDVNGKNENELFTFLKSLCPQPGTTIVGDGDICLWSPIRTTDIYWNFEKFLINEDGFPLKRYSASTQTGIDVDIRNAILSCQSRRLQRVRIKHNDRYDEDDGNNLNEYLDSIFLAN